MSNRFLAALRGKNVIIMHPGWVGHSYKGVLVAWDSYSIVLHIQGADSLVTKAPGMEIRADEEGTT